MNGAELLVAALEYGEFNLKVPSGPGLGISIDKDRFSRFRRDRAERGFHFS